MNTIAMALAGYSEHMDDLWRKICSENRCQLPDPYLQAVFAFLASETSNYDAVLVSGVGDSGTFCRMWFCHLVVVTWVRKWKHYSDIIAVVSMFSPTYTNISWS